MTFNMTELVKIIELNFLFLLEYHYGRDIKSMGTYRCSYDTSLEYA